MKFKLKRLAAGLVATTIVGVTPLLMATPASAAPVNAGPAVVTGPGGTGTVNSGDSTTDFSIRFGAGPFPDGPDAGTTPDTVATCTKDGTDNGRAHSYMIPGNQSPATDLFFGGTGAIVADGAATGASVGTGGTGTFKNNLRVAGSTTQLRNIPLNAGDAAILMSSNLDFSGFTAGQIPSGTYNIGIACVDIASGDGTYEPTNYWNQVITVTYPGGPATGAQITWAVGVADAAPVLTTVTPGDGTLQAAFTHSPSNPANTTYTVTATPTAGAPVTQTGAASPITVSGLTNGTQYAVTVTATNPAGTSPASNSVNGTPNEAARPPVANLTGSTGAPGSTTATLDWDAPLSGPTPTGYSVTVDPVAGTVNVSGTGATVTGLAVGTYTITVTPLHPFPATGTPASVMVAIVPSSVLYQEIDVTRPVGALVLTQKCGVGLVAPNLGPNGTGGTDPNFGEYPYPVDALEVPNPTYPTYCGVDLGIAKLITSGTGAGQFFRATGELGQVTVVDTRDGDEGWTVNGTMGDFISGPDSFSGSQLGWDPEVVSTTPTWTDSLGNSYTQAVTAGGVVVPNSLVASGLSSGRPLAIGTPGSGLGIAVLEAALDLLIPVTADNGNYTGLLTITVA